MALDLAPLLEPISPDSPSGEDLSDDQARVQLARDIQYKRLADKFEPPPWPKIKKEAQELARRSHDLRLWVFLTRSLAATDGLPAVVAGLQVIRDGLRRHWQTLYPLIDESEDQDDNELRVLQRKNALAALVAGNFERGSFLDDLRLAQIVSLKGIGPISLSQLRAARNGGGPAPEVIKEAFKQMDPAPIEAAQQAAEAVPVLVDEIGVAFHDLSGGVKVFEDKDLKQVQDIAAEIVVEIARYRPTPIPPETKADSAAGESQDYPAISDGSLETRNDVISALNRVLDYYRREEPTSPIPLLVERTKRLVPMDFLQLMEELAPGGLKQIREIGGLDKIKDKES